MTAPVDHEGARYWSQDWIDHCVGESPPDMREGHFFLVAKAYLDLDARLGEMADALVAIRDEAELLLGDPETNAFAAFCYDLAVDALPANATHSGADAIDAAHEGAKA